MAAPRPVASSFWLQVLLYFHVWFLLLWFVAEVLMMIWKSYVLPYPDRNWVSEFVLLWAFAAVDGMRVFFGMKGNLTEQNGAMSVFLAFTAPAVFCYIFFLIWQTYVLRAEMILAIIGLVLDVAQVMFSLLAMARFARKTPLH